MDSLVAHGTPSRERGHRREGSYHYIPISRPRTKPLRAKYKEKRKNVDAASEFKVNNQLILCRLVRLAYFGL